MKLNIPAAARGLLAGGLAAFTLGGCRLQPTKPPCTPPSAVHLLIDPDTGQLVVPQWVGRLRDGVDNTCTAPSRP